MSSSGVQITGTVANADGSPAAGAEVFSDPCFMPMGDWVCGIGSLRQVVRDEDGAWGWGAEPPDRAPAQTVADAQGRFVLEIPDPQENEALAAPIQVWASLQHRVAPKVLLRVEGEAPPPVALALGPSIQPRVELVDAAGDPVVGACAAMDLHVFDEHGEPILEWLYTIAARSDERGIACLPAIPDRDDWDASLRVTGAERPQYLDWEFPADALRGPDPVRVILPSGCTVRGRVELPHPSPGAAVTVSARRDPHNPNPGSESATFTEADGSFELRGVPTQAILTFLEWPAEATEVEVFFDTTGGARLTRHVRAGEGEVLDLGMVRIPPPETIRGVVRGIDGQPVTHGLVMLDGPGSSRPILEDGTFEIAGLEPGRYTVHAEVEAGDPGPGARSRPRLRGTVRDVASGAEGVVIDVHEGGTLLIRLHPQGRPGEPLEVWEAMLEGEDGSTGFSGKPSELRVRLEPGPRSDLRLRAEGYKPAALGEIEILPDRATVVDLEMEPET